MATLRLAWLEAGIGTFSTLDASSQTKITGLPSTRTIDGWLVTLCTCSAMLRSGRWYRLPVSDSTRSVRLRPCSLLAKCSSSYLPCS